MGTLAASRKRAFQSQFFSQFFYPSEKYPAQCGEKLERMISIDKCVFLICVSDYIYIYCFKMC